MNLLTLRLERLRWLPAGVALACIATLPAAPPATATTAPGVPAHLFMTVTDRKITLDIPRNQVLPRGVVVSFVVKNKGRLPHRFSILGHTTPVIRPGKTGRTTFIIFNRRGRFHFFDPLHRRSKSLRGYIRIV